ncbi:hypothetical protein TWF569_004343 [Orbilia oligospora]|uniref:Uncharacterized protein n=1 Tax=Orbilia oligospora TaxID=2813651 RepID=A0A7C8N562_ORBOL|nr:hypothetical protein TWF102_000517 [Orbilia oligospora]KAF3097465.1 hypothetical protein TWF706_007324 [Orbilia oligospora]KAF3104328.1 hypothetical protein TWF103_006986 [Orbilia oligospora]KAF3129613.1 hypothetical protein TWF594_010905 [Orbilia oligospora]KAF3150802.1 hypothetical protein TWF569_004343 [Orbilia oligospora]
MFAPFVPPGPGLPAYITDDPDSHTSERVSTPEARDRGQDAPQKKTRTSKTSSARPDRDPDLPPSMCPPDEQPKTIWQRALVEGAYLKDSLCLLSGISTCRSQLYRRYRLWGFRRREAILATRGLRPFRYCQKCKKKHWTKKCKKSDKVMDILKDPADELGVFAELQSGDYSRSERLSTTVEGKGSKLWKKFGSVENIWSSFKSKRSSNVEEYPSCF